MEQHEMEHDTGYKCIGRMRSASGEKVEIIHHWCDYDEMFAVKRGAAEQILFSRSEAIATARQWLNS